MSTAPDSIVEFRSVGYEIETARILGDLSFSVKRGEIFVLLGESGCGKTTTLKLINRLIEPTSGEILVNGREIGNVDAVVLRRAVGYVMQEGGLFPHYTVRENISVVPRLLKTDAAVIEKKVSELLGLVGLETDEFSARFPHELSGGQRQRVGVARALAADPELLLLDEPFGALDALTRVGLQKEFARLVRELGKTAIFVTHDLHEAFMLASRICLMDRGRIVHLAEPEAFRTSDDPLVMKYLETISV